MTLPVYIKKRVLQLRRKGKTYSDINSLLKRNIPKGTLSGWLKNLHLSAESQDLLNKNIALKLENAQFKAKLINREKRVKYLDFLKNKNLSLLKKLDKPTSKLILSILYISEGAKSKSTFFLSLSNSNPEIIRFYMTLLDKCFSIDRSKYRVRIQCRADQNVKVLENYWGKTTQLPRKQFYPTYVDKRTVGKPTLHENYKGVCTLHYFDRSIQLELELLAESVIKYVIEGR